MTTAEEMMMTFNKHAARLCKLAEVETAAVWPVGVSEAHRAALISAVTAELVRVLKRYPRAPAWEVDTRARRAIRSVLELCFAEAQV